MVKSARRIPLLLAGAVLSAPLAGCVYDGGGYYYGDYDDAYYYDGYYDGYYGPYAGGYWAVDGFFYYWLKDRYHRDDRRHFRRDNFRGSYRFQGDRDGPSRWHKHGYQPPSQYHQQLPPPAHPPPRQRQRRQPPAGHH